MSMALLRDASIRRKVSGIAMLTSGAALVLACIAFLAYELLTYRAAMVEDLSATAALIGDNSSAALMFDDPESAAKTLKSLDTHPGILAAALYDRNGRLFAQYQGGRQADFAKIPSRPGAPGYRFGLHDLVLFHSFDVAKELVGTVYVQSDLGHLYSRMQRYTLIGLAVFAVAFAIAFVLAQRLQSLISGPIARLAAVMTVVAAERNYSVRAERHGNDELGRLIDGFNAMLDQIQVQDVALKDAQHGLEERVAERTCELELTHRKLIEISRQAGMAEVATNVLHNVGNVLNSVNVSTSILGDRLARSRVQSVARLAQLLAEQREALADFLVHDLRGVRVVQYIAHLADHLDAERRANLKEIASLRTNIEHIKEIVAMQQGYAKVAGIRELLSPSELVEDALRFNADAIAQHGIALIRDYASVQQINTEKHKVLQILVNLIRNAQLACVEAGGEGRAITLRISATARGIVVAVTDNGVGIAAENMTRIFAYGFTTRSQGHGFGLHSAALAARELGGALRAFSDGLGRGATFELELPRERRLARGSADSDAGIAEHTEAQALDASSSGLA